MIEAIEKFRQSEAGKICFYVFSGIVLALFLIAFSRGSKKNVSMFSNNGNGNHFSGKLKKRDKLKK